MGGLPGATGRPPVFPGPFWCCGWQSQPRCHPAPAAGHLAPPPDHLASAGSGWFNRWPTGWLVGGHLRVRSGPRRTGQTPSVRQVAARCRRVADGAVGGGCGESCRTLVSWGRGRGRPWPKLVGQVVNGRVRDGRWACAATGRQPLRATGGRTSRTRGSLLAHPGSQRPCPDHVGPSGACEEGHNSYLALQSVCHMARRGPRWRATLFDSRIGAKGTWGGRVPPAVDCDYADLSWCRSRARRAREFTVRGYV